MKNLSINSNKLVKSSFTIVLLFVFSFFACNRNTQIDTKIQTPEAAELIFPFENSECNIGTDSTDTESSVLFEWNKSANTDYYEINITNLFTNEIIKDTTSENTALKVLKRATAYSWYIVSLSHSSEDSTKSEIWRFYNAGIAIEAHIPFPAEIISPKMSEQITTLESSISLTWHGNDLDNDINYYNVFFGTDKQPPLYASNVTDTTLSGVNISSNTIYFWEIECIDKKENSSKSGIYQFKIN